MSSGKLFNVYQHLALKDSPLPLNFIANMSSPTSALHLLDFFLLWGCLFGV